MCFCLFSFHACSLYGLGFPHQQQAFSASWDHVEIQLLWFLTQANTPLAPHAAQPDFLLKFGGVISAVTKNLLVAFSVWIQNKAACASPIPFSLISGFPTVHVQFNIQDPFRPCLFQQSTYDTCNIFFSEDTCLEEKTVVPHLVAKLCSGTEPVCKSNQFLGPEGNVDIELIDKSANRYR